MTDPKRGGTGWSGTERIAVLELGPEQKTLFDNE